MFNISAKAFIRFLQHLYARFYCVVFKKRISLKSVTLEMPHSNNSDAPADLYSFYWFAENLQYYNFDFFRIKGFLSKSQTYLLSGSNFATFPLQYNFDDYLKNVLKSSERALIRKALKNGYFAKEINYDDHLDDIRQINTSKLERQGQEMSDDYKNIVNRDFIVKPFNNNIRTFGCFSPDGTLVAYYMFEKFTNFFHTNKGIGHKEHLSMGIMNLLFAHSISELSKDNHDCILIYGLLAGREIGGLNKFKYNVGCIPKKIIYKGSKDDFRDLMLFRKRFTLRGDSSLNFVRDYIISNTTTKT